MNETKENIYKMLDCLQDGLAVLLEEKPLNAKQAGYIHGYEDALKNIRFIVSVSDKF